MEAQLGLFEEEVIPLVKKKVIEYFLVIKPDRHLMDLITNSKQSAGCIVPLSRENRWLPPHLSLIRMHVRLDSDEAMIHLVSEALKEVTRFRIILRGLQVYNHARELSSLVLGVGNPGQVEALYTSLAQKFKLKPTAYVPHIPILKTLSKKDLAALYNFMPQFDHRGSFLCDKVLLLKKSGEEGSRFRLLHEVVLK